MQASSRAVVSPQRFSRRNMLHFLCGAVAAQRLAVAMEHEKNVPACAHERQNNRTAASIRLPYQAREHIMDLDFKIFDSERFITEVEKRPALYNKVTPEYSDKHCKEKLWVEVCEAVVTNWSRMDTTARVATGKSVKTHFYVHCTLFVETVEYSFIIFL